MANCNYDWSHVTDVITKEQLINWIAELRSGKFKQTYGALHCDDAFCCLGVFAHLQNSLHDYCFTIDELRGSDTELWWHSDGELSCNYFSGYFYLPEKIQSVLASMNDGIPGRGVNYSFYDISCYLEHIFGLTQ
jgi:hypothetical protein